MHPLFLTAAVTAVGLSALGWARARRGPSPGLVGSTVGLLLVGLTTGVSMSLMVYLERVTQSSGATANAWVDAMWADVQQHALVGLGVLVLLLAVHGAAALRLRAQSKEVVTAPGVAIGLLGLMPGLVSVGHYLQFSSAYTGQAQAASEALFRTAQYGLLGAPVAGTAALLALVYGWVRSRRAERASEH